MKIKKTMANINLNKKRKAETIIYRGDKSEKSEF